MTRLFEVTYTVKGVTHSKIVSYSEKAVLLQILSQLYPTMPVKEEEVKHGPIRDGWRTFSG